MLGAEEWRGEETWQTNQEAEWSAQRGDHVAQELKSLDRDVISDVRDRDYRAISVFRKELLATPMVDVRAFYLRTRGDGGYEQRVRPPPHAQSYRWGGTDRLHVGAQASHAMVKVTS